MGSGSQGVKAKGTLTSARTGPTCHYTSSRNTQPVSLPILWCTRLHLHGEWSLTAPSANSSECQLYAQSTQPPRSHQLRASGQWAPGVQVTLHSWVESPARFWVCPQATAPDPSLLAWFRSPFPPTLAPIPTSTRPTPWTQTQYTQPLSTSESCASFPHVHKHTHTHTCMCASARNMTMCVLSLFNCV